MANVGNGGANQADANAGKASCGKGKKAEPDNAEISTYEGLVRRHLGRESKLSKVGKGEALVSFVVGKVATSRAFGSPDRWATPGSTARRSPQSRERRPTRRSLTNSVPAAGRSRYQ